ncbi:g8083 [Coccomyxa elongata]
MAVAVQQSSAANLLALLDEEDDALKLYALQSLNKVVHEFWYQIATVIASVEAFYEDEEFSHRELAALVASKVFYHLGELDDALSYALGAGKLFDINEPSEYVQTTLDRCIDQYVQLRNDTTEEGKAKPVDERLSAIVERLFERCFRDGQFEQAVGVALETRRLDKLEQAVQKAPEKVATLTYALRVCQKLVISREFRFQVLRLLIKLYESVENPDWVNIAQCLLFLDDAPEVAKILDKLLKGSEDDTLLAYQVCFDLVENESQSFLMKVGKVLEEHAPKTAAPATEQAAADDADQDTPAGSAGGEALANGNGAAHAPADAMETDGGAAGAPAPTVSLTPEEQQYVERYNRLKGIISGATSIGLYLEFLYSHNHADLQILKNVKTASEVRNSVCHSAVIFANAIMHSGTTVDSFLRGNLDWLSRATNWAKFSATAGLGVIHRGHLSQGRALMAPYLPRNGASGSPYSEGGALYALGLTYANHGHDVKDFLLHSLRETASEVTQHGACLGLGLAALGTEDEVVFEEIKNVLYTDSAVAGEAAGIALGLVSVGSASDKASELLTYAHDTQHEKIIRGVVLGLALIMYGQEEGAETLIEDMTRDQDPILRYGGMFVMGMAYRGTANNGAIQKLLHFAVSDVSDDVRRAAVLNLGFLLMGVPDQCPPIVALLSESYNPHVRYGAAMAVGVACAGTGMRSALDLLSPLLTDAVDFVRQGTLISTALILMQQPEAKVSAFRKRLEKVVGDKHEEVMARMGAIMATGLLDAGGRNLTVGLRSASGYFRRTSVVGLMLFLQYWYWYPLSYCISLALQPSAVIALNADLKLPRMQVVCKCKPSLFAYPPPVTQETASTAAKVPTAVLSTTARAREKAKKKEAEKKAEGDKPASTSDAAETAMETDDKEAVKEPEAAGDKAEAVPAKEPEPSSHKLDNPSRVVPTQQKFVALEPNSRWVPIHKNRPIAGIIVLKDLHPGEPVDLLTSISTMPQGPDGPAQPNGQNAAPTPANFQEPAPPEPFEYTPT